MRDKIILSCTECKERNYHKTKNKRLHPERVEYKKYCPRCNKQTPHKETKKPDVKWRRARRMARPSRLTVLTRQRADGRHDP